jgi:hypothetical protein
MYRLCFQASVPPTKDSSPSRVSNQWERLLPEQMNKSQHRNLRNMRKQGKMTVLKVNNSTVIDFEVTVLDEILDKAFKFMIYKMISEFKEDTNKLLNELRKTTKDIKEHNKIDIQRKNQTEVMEIKA